MNADANKIIDRLGGTVATAAICRRSKGAVSQWRTNGIPDAIEQLLRVIRPDVFSDIEIEKCASFKPPQCGSSDPRHGERRGPDQRHQADRRSEDKAL